MKEMITADEIRKSGIEALIKALGPVGMARFIQQFEEGNGDYTRDRDQWLGDLTVDGVLEEIKEGKEQG